MEPVDVLRYARDAVLTDESKWTKEAFARRADGSGTTSDDPLAASFCVAGAVGRAAQELSAEQYEAHQLIRWEAELNERRLHDRHPVPGVNDHPDTTFSDVIDLFDRAIKKAEEA